MKTSTLLTLLLLSFALLASASACGDEGSSTRRAPEDGNNANNAVANNAANNTAPGALTWLAPTEHLVRASMALRGVRPSVEEVNAVRANPDALPGIIDGYLQSAEFGETIRDMHNEALLLRPFFFWFPPRGAMADIPLVEFNRSVSDAPLRLIEHVVMEDRPYSEIVTADYTLADPIVASVWGMEHDGAEGEWIETRWPEPGRVHAGLLTDSKVYVRHYSTPLNAQRARANFISRTFLCFNFLDNDINVDGNVDLSDPDAVKSSVKRAECASCHQTLDPLSSIFWKHEFFVFPATIEQYPYSHYKPEYEQYRPYFTDRAPGYFGRPVEDERDLGAALAADPRFSLCAARRFFAWFTETDIDAVPHDIAAELQEEFVGSGMNARALARAIVLSDTFRTAHDPARELPAHAVKKIRPRDLSRMMEALTGYRWTITIPFPLDFLVPGVPYGETDLLRDHLFGYEVIAGGLDDFIVTLPVHTVNPTGSLVFENFAYEAAGAIVERDLGTDDPQPRRVLTIGAEETGEAAVRAQLADLHERFFAVPNDPASEDVDAAWQLFSDALALTDDPARAWKTTLAALLQDSRLIYY